MLMDHPNQDAILAAAVQIDIVLENLQSVTMAQDRHTIARLVDESTAAIRKLRTLAGDHFEEDSEKCYEQLSELERQFRTIADRASASQADINDIPRCRACGTALSESQSTKHCTVCSYSVIPTFIQLGRLFQSGSI